MADKIVETIKTKLSDVSYEGIIGSKIEVQGLGLVNVLRVVGLKDTWDSVDPKYANKLLIKESV